MTTFGRNVKALARQVFNGRCALVAAFFALLILTSGCEESNYSRPDLPELPVNVLYRESLVGEGYVARFQNLSEKYMQVRVRLSNPTLRTVKNSYVDLRPNEITELGWLEGWKFVSGETIEMFHEGFRSQKWRIP
jgi:hypothetical protein